MDNDWPWDQPPNCAVISEKGIVENGAVILLIAHDLDDHGWQFLSGEKFKSDNAVLVSLAQISKIDPTVNEVARMLPGYYAWRKSKNQPWVMERDGEDQN